MYMLQQQSDAISSSVASKNTSSDSDNSDNDDDSDNDYPDDNFADEEKTPSDTREALQVSSVDSLFSDDPNGNDGGGGGGRRRSSGALIMAGRASKPDRINLRSISEQEADDRLDDEYGMSPSKLHPIAKIKTLFDATPDSADVRYHHLTPPSLERNTSSSSQTNNNDNLVDLELAPSQRRHAADVPSVNWDLSNTAWSQHIQQSAFDASSRPPGDWEAPSNEVIYERKGRNKWEPIKYTKRQLCWWFWQISVAIGGAVVLIILISKSKSS